MWNAYSEFRYRQWPQRAARGDASRHWRCGSRRPRSPSKKAAQKNSSRESCPWLGKSDRKGQPRRRADAQSAALRIRGPSTQPTTPWLQPIKPGKDAGRKGNRLAAAARTSRLPRSAERDRRSPKPDVVRTRHNTTRHESSRNDWRLINEQVMQLRRMY